MAKFKLVLMEEIDEASSTPITEYDIGEDDGEWNIHDPAVDEALMDQISDDLVRYERKKKP